MGDRTACVCLESNQSQMSPADFQVRPTEAISSHHYLCSCTQELWVLLMHLIQHRNKVLHTRVTTKLPLRCITFPPCCANVAPPVQSFWSYMSLLLRPLVSGEPVDEAFKGLPTHCKDPLGFSWWLVTHLAMLGQYCRNGTLQSEVRNPLQPDPNCAGFSTDLLQRLIFFYTATLHVLHVFSELFFRCI